MQIYIQPVLLQEYSKSFAVTGLPSDHFASFLKWNVYVFRPLKHPFFEFRFTKKIFPSFYSQYNYYCKYNLFCILYQDIDAFLLLLYNILTTVCFVFL